MNRPIPCDVQQDDAEVRTERCSDKRGGNSHESGCGVEPQPTTHEGASDCRSEADDPRADGGTAAYPGEVDPQTNWQAHRQDHQWLVVERDPGNCGHDDQFTEEPSADAEHEWVQRPEQGAGFSSEGGLLQRPAR